MAAPAVAALVALLTSAGGVATAPWALHLIRGEQVVAGVYADLPAICSATDPLIDALGDAYPNSIELARVVSIADVVCSAANRPNASPNPASLVPTAIIVIKAAAAKAGAASSEPAANGAGRRAVR